MECGLRGKKLNTFSPLFSGRRDINLGSLQIRRKGGSGSPDSVFSIISSVGQERTAFPLPGKSRPSVLLLTTILARYRADSAASGARVQAHETSIVQVKRKVRVGLGYKLKQPSEADSGGWDEVQEGSRMPTVHRPSCDLDPAAPKHLQAALHSPQVQVL